MLRNRRSEKTCKSAIRRCLPGGCDLTHVRQILPKDMLDRSGAQYFCTPVIRLSLILKGPFVRFSMYFDVTQNSSADRESAKLQVLLIKKVMSPIRGPRCPEGSSKLGFSDFMTTAQNGGKVVSLTRLPTLPLGNAPGTHFCWGPR
jgi:hypothetical protein